MRRCTRSAMGRKSMATYLIGDINIIDASAYGEYRHRASELVAHHHGEYIVRGGQIEVVAGEWHPNSLVIIRFPDTAAVRAYLADPGFQQLAPLRKRAITS